MKSGHRHVAGDTDDAAAPAGTNYVDDIRVVEKDEPLTNMDGDGIPNKVSTDHAHGTGRKGLRGRGERRHQEAS